MSLLLAALLACSACWCATASAAPGWLIQQRQGAVYSTTLLSSDGASTTMSQRGKARGTGKHRKPGKVTPFGGTTLRYDDGRAWLLSYLTHTYDTLLLRVAFQRQAAEDRMVAHATPSYIDGNPAKITTKPLPARLRATGAHATIHGLPARGYLLTSGTSVERMWVATSLPAPPTDIIAAITAAAKRPGATSMDRELGKLAGRIILRTESRHGKRWKLLLDTTSVRRREVAASAFAAPKGWKQASSNRHRATTAPGTAGRHAASVPATARSGVGLVSTHPEPWALYWGTDFQTHFNFIYAMNYAIRDLLISPNFTVPLRQYGIEDGHFLGYTVINEDPPRSVGGANFLSIDWLVLSNRYGSDAPNVWWTVGGHDPFFMVFVDKDKVHDGGWDGYHFLTPTEAALIPFPGSLFAHAAMPWMIAKVEPGALTATAQDPLVRGRCHGEAPAEPGPVCSRLTEFDKSTAIMSHEFVETITDPYPFFSWSDIGKFPVWSQGELADICQEGDISPYGKFSVAGATNVYTFWSNAANACVPESRPTLSIGEPIAGSQHIIKSPVGVTGAVKDPVDGNGDTAIIQWTLDGNFLGTGGLVAAPATLGLGTHVLVAKVTDSQGLSTSQTRTFTIAANPPTVSINSPSDGASFGNDQTITYRANVFDGLDGTLPASSIQWWLDAVGTGGTLMGTGATLPFKITAQGVHNVYVKATDSINLSTTKGITVTVTAPLGNPDVTITSPVDSSSYGTGDLIPFAVTATSPIDGTMSGSSIVWSSSVNNLGTFQPEGNFGTGASLSHALSGGPCYIAQHMVTVTATDSASHVGTDHVLVNVGGIC